MESIVIYPPQRNYGRLIVGLLGFGFSLVVLFLFLLPVFRKEISYRLKKVFGQEQIRQLADEDNQEKGLKVAINLTDRDLNKQENTAVAEEEFRLVIPKIGVDTTVFANVDANDEEAFKDALVKGVAHAKGSYLPGQLGSSFIFGHSTDYPWNVGWMNAVFYLLKELEKGDEVYVYYHGKRLDYLVTDKRIVEAEEVAFLKSRLSEERVVLQTCWPPGTRLKRLLVISHPKDFALRAL